MSKNTFEKILKSKNFKKIELPDVIESKHILKRSGEMFRKNLFSFYDNNLTEWSLRPDLTLCSAILMKNVKSKKKIFYEGTSFAKSFDKSVAKKQQGFEIFFSTNKNQDDREILDLSLRILKKNNLNKNAVLKINNVEIFNALINRLEGWPTRWRDRVKRHFSRKIYLNELLSKLSTNFDIDPVIVKKDKQRAIKLKKLNQNTIYAGRSLKSILDRFYAKMNDPRTKLGRKNSKIIKDYLRLECSIKDAPSKLNKFFKKNNLNLVITNDYFPFKKDKIDNVKILFSTDVGRNVGYYSGMSFNINIIKNKNKITYISGGRFNNLLQSLGYKSCPAVGAAINLI